MGRPYATLCLRHNTTMIGLRSVSLFLRGLRLGSQVVRDSSSALLGRTRHNRGSEVDRYHCLGQLMYVNEKVLYRVINDRIDVRTSRMGFPLCKG